METFTGNRGGGTTGPYLTLEWHILQTDVTNNRSKVGLVLRLHASHRINFSASKSGVLHGSGFSYVGGANGTGVWVLRTAEVWVGHNSDGTKSQSFSGSFNIAISYGGSHVSSLSVSGTATLPVIPRATTISAFSFGSHLQPSTAVTINYTVSRKSDNFRHQIKLLDGSHEVQVWDNISSNGASTVSLSTASVNNLLNRMSSATSRSLTLRIATRSGVNGGWIGSAVTKNATATVSDTVVPTISALTLSQTGNTVTTAYLQGKSKVTGSFTRSGGYGATVASSSITVRRKTNNDDVQTINSNSGTTDKVIAHSGTYQAQGMVRDSRGRVSYTAWTDFAVTAYTSPRITTFTADRVTATPTTVTISRAGTHSHLGGSNVLTYTVQRRIGTGAWTNVNTNATGTSIVASFTGTSTSTGNSVTSSYDFRMVVTDKFDERAESIVTVSTQRVVLDIHKNEGVGIGKIRERGVLDVDGSAYLSGDVFVNGVSISRAESILNAGIPPSDTISYYQELPQGIYFVSQGQLPNQPSNFGVIYHTNRGGDFSLMWYTQSSGAIYRKSGNANNLTEWVLVDRPASGSTPAGDWVRFRDGTQICTGGFTNDFSTKRTLQVPLPASFLTHEYSVAISAGNGNWQPGEIASTVGSGPASASAMFFQRYNSVNHDRVGGVHAFRFMAIGRF